MGWLMIWVALLEMTNLCLYIGGLVRTSYPPRANQRRSPSTPWLQPRSFGDVVLHVWVVAGEDARDSDVILFLSLFFLAARTEVHDKGPLTCWNGYVISVFKSCHLPLRNKNQVACAYS